MSAGLLTHLQRETWNLWVTCTYRKVNGMSEQVRRSMQMKWLRRVSEFTGTKGRAASWENLTWVIREEYGESTDRIHWHALVGGLPLGVVKPTTCTYLMGYWEGMGGGMARIRVFDAGQGAAEYMAKGLEGNMSGANRYEVGKFCPRQGAQLEPLMLIPSKTLLAKWKRLAAKDGGKHSAQSQAKLPIVT